MQKTLNKYKIGTIKDYVPIARFDTPFAVAMLDRCRAAVKGKPLRDSFFVYSSLLVYYTCFISAIAYSFYTAGQSYFLALGVGFLMAVGHLVGHAGNHWSLSSNETLNRFLSLTCTNLWGLREKNWEFSHLISHHCYNYTDRDYIMEQHVPLQYFRVRECDAWRPIHAYQHIIYLFTPLTGFIMGALRLDCAPWVLLSPLLAPLRRNQDSPMPAPQFFAAGSNIDIDRLQKHEDGVGPYNYLVYKDFFDEAVSCIMSNIIWMPLFFYVSYHRGILHGVLYNSICFGMQAMLATRTLLTQHLCEDIKLPKSYGPTDDWYAMQVEASTSIQKAPVIMWLTYAVSFQTEHHMFPCLNPQLLLDLQPIVQKTAEEFNVQYNYFPSDQAAYASVYKQFVKLSVKPEGK